MITVRLDKGVSSRSVLRNVSGRRPDPRFALQRQFGNRAVAELIRAAAMHGQGHDTKVLHNGTLASVHGTAEGQFNGGPWTVEKQKVGRGKGCVECDECVQATGTVVANYSVGVTITMPDVPEGLTECEAATMRKWISTTLRAHENEHKRRLETYNGTTRRAFNIKGCSADEITAKIEAQQTTEAEAREKKAADYSALIDPYEVDIPNKCKD